MLMNAAQILEDMRSFRKDYKKLGSSRKDLSKLAIVIDTH